MGRLERATEAGFRKMDARLEYLVGLIERDENRPKRPSKADPSARKNPPAQKNQPARKNRPARKNQPAASTERGQDPSGG